MSLEHSPTPDHCDYWWFLTEKCINFTRHLEHNTLRYTRFSTHSPICNEKKQTVSSISLKEPETNTNDKTNAHADTNSTSNSNSNKYLYED